MKRPRIALRSVGSTAHESAGCTLLQVLPGLAVAAAAACPSPRRATLPDIKCCPPCCKVGGRLPLQAADSLQVGQC